MLEENYESEQDAIWNGNCEHTYGTWNEYDWYYKPKWREEWVQKDTIHPSIEKSSSHNCEEDSQNRIQILNHDNGCDGNDNSRPG